MNLLSTRRGGHDNSNYNHSDTSRFADAADIKVWARDEDELSQVSQSSRDSRSCFVPPPPSGDLRDRLRNRNSATKQQQFGSTQSFASLQNFGSYNNDSDQWGGQHDSRTGGGERQHWSEGRELSPPRHNAARQKQRQFEDHQQRPASRNNRGQDERRERNHGGGGGRQEQRNGGGHNSSSGGRQLARPKKNTENFNPSHEAPEMRILFAPFGCQVRASFFIIFLCSFLFLGMSK